MDEQAKLRFQAQSLGRAMQAARLLDDEMPLRTLEVFLHIAAASEAMNFRDLVDKMGIPAPAVTRNVASLCAHSGGGKEGLGLVQTSEDINDRRVKRVALTAKGRRFLESLMTPLEVFNGKRT